MALETSQYNCVLILKIEFLLTFLISIRFRIWKKEIGKNGISVGNVCTEF